MRICIERKKKTDFCYNNYNISCKHRSIKRADVSKPLKILNIIQEFKFFFFLPGRLPKKPNRRTNAMGIRLVLAIVVIPVGPLETFFGQTFPVRKEIPVK